MENKILHKKISKELIIIWLNNQRDFCNQLNFSTHISQAKIQAPITYYKSPISRLF